MKCTNDVQSQYFGLLLGMRLEAHSDKSSEQSDFLTWTAHQHILKKRIISVSSHRKSWVKSLCMGELVGSWNTYSAYGRHIFISRFSFRLTHY
jgi:hypothetical protein